MLWLARAPSRLRGRIAALIARAEPEACAGVLNLAKDRDPMVRRAVMQALRSCDDRTAVPVLLAGLDDPRAEVGLAAARALGGQCTAKTLADLLLPERWREASRATAKRLTLAMVGCLEHVPTASLDTRTQSELEQTLVRQFEAATNDSELASLAVRGFAFFPSQRVFARLSQAYPGAPPPLRVAILRASVPHRSNAARNLRRLAAEAAEPAVAATARVAAWLARDPDTESPEAALGERAGRDLAWPLGPVHAFLLASLRVRAEGPASMSPMTTQQAQALCAALASPEPITRANAEAAWAAGVSGACPPPSAATPPRPSPSIRTPANSRNMETSVWQPGAFRALVMADGRVFVSAADASGSVSWLDLPEMVTENPWPEPYATE